MPPDLVCSLDVMRDVSTAAFRRPSLLQWTMDNGQKREQDAQSPEAESLPISPATPVLSSLPPSSTTVADSPTQHVLPAPCPTPSSSSPSATLKAPSPLLGTLSLLPPELRLQIYTHLLTSPFPSPPTFGPASTISPALLACSSALHAEAAPLLYNPTHPTGHIITNAPARPSPVPSPPLLPPQSALQRIPRLTLRLTFRTLNRGECETAIVGFDGVCAFAEAVAFALRRSAVLRELRIELLNENQRKRGARLVRSEVVRGQVRGLLRVFAECVGEREGVRVVVGGFDTLEYVEMWEGLVAEGRRGGGGGEMGVDGLIQGLMREVLDGGGGGGGI
ncbi:hypothetical protein FH972_023942 [Carpinus fangiana]|uniref:Uncharacterized protein n=1 Tax=Carpinus fangiana TaxID=176857 RepID=A0A5N6KXA3_9ROSI|nr:hypothetical protein FH972_023942 [Carpinus fangiana]